MKQNNTCMHHSDERKSLRVQSPFLKCRTLMRMKCSLVVCYFYCTKEQQIACGWLWMCEDSSCQRVQWNKTKPNRIEALFHGLSPPPLVYLWSEAGSSTRHFSIKMHTICNLNVDFVNAANNSMEWTHMGCLGLWHWLCYRTEMNSLCEVRTCGLSFERVAFEWFRMLWLVWMVRISAAKFCCLAAFYSRRWIVNCIANEINFNGHCLCIRQMLIKHSL